MKIDGMEILGAADIRRALLLKFLKFADVLELSYSAITLFNPTIEDDVELIKQGHGSTVVVAARIYTICLLSGERRSQKKISIATHCSIGALSKLYRFNRKKKMEEGGPGSISSTSNSRSAAETRPSIFKSKEVMRRCKQEPDTLRRYG